MARTKKAKNKSTRANLGFEATLWAEADKLRGQLDAADYKRWSKVSYVVYTCHNGKISIDCQKSTLTAWKLAKLNLDLRGIDAFTAHHFTFRNDQHPTLKGFSQALFFGVQL